MKLYRYDVNGDRGHVVAKNKEHAKRLVALEFSYVTDPVMTFTKLANEASAKNPLIIGITIPTDPFDFTGVEARSLVHMIAGAREVIVDGKVIKSNTSDPTVTRHLINNEDTALVFHHTTHHRHKARGSTYRRLGEASVQSSTPIVEGRAVTVYVSDADGNLVVRPLSEFNDGRFEEIVP